MPADEKPHLLDPRLSSVFSLVRKGSVCVDVGSDHAYLICSLVESGTVPYATATDINPLPLKNAEKEIARRGLSGKIRTVLCDGLSSVSPDDAQDVIIAGMGGELIGDIISAAPWLCDCEKNLVLQPMSKADRLRRFLYLNGFSIIRETVSRADGRLYTAFSARYTGKKREISPVFALLGLVPTENSDAAREYITHQARRAEKTAAGLLLSDSEKERLRGAWYRHLSEILDDVSKGGPYLDLIP